MNSNKEIKIAAIISYLTIFLNIIIGLVYTPWMIKSIGKSDYGLYVLVSSFLIYFTIDFGLGQAISRFLTKYQAEKNNEKINQLLSISTKVYLVISLVMLISLIIVFFLIENIFTQLNSDEIEKFKVVYIIAGLFSFLSFPFMPLNGILISHEKFIFLKLCDFLSKIIVIVSMIILLCFGYKLYALVAVNVGVNLLIIIFKLIFILNKTSIKINFSYNNISLLKELFSFSIWTSVIGIAQRLLINIAPTLLGIYSGTTSITIFSIGILIESYLWTFASAMNGLFLPKVTALQTSETDRKEILKLMIKVGRIQLVVIGILYIGIVVLGKEFISLWMGEGYEQSYLVILLLIMPGFFSLTQEIASTLLLVENKLKAKAIIFVMASILSVLISIFLIPFYDAVGAALGIAISLLIFEVFCINVMYYKVLKLDVIYFFKECQLKLFPTLLITMLFGFLIDYLVKADNFILFFMKVIFIVIFYLISIWFVGLNIFEKDLFRSVFFKIFNKIK